MKIKQIIKLWTAFDKKVTLIGKTFGTMGKELLPRFKTSALLTLNIFSNPKSPIFSKNSGIIDKWADTIVYLVNKTLIPFAIVSKVKNTVTANDLPDPLPPVIMKYLALDENNALYLLFRFSFYKVY